MRKTETETERQILIDNESLACEDKKIYQNRLTTADEKSGVAEVVYSYKH